MEKRSQNSLVCTQVQKLASGLFLDLASFHPHLKKSLVSDFERFSKRLNLEGMGFATQALPRLGKAVYRSFESGHFVCPLGFAKQRGTALPRFLGGLLTCCYAKDGKLRPDCDPACLVDIIQVCFQFYKLDLPYSPKQEKKVLDDFVETERELGQLIIQDDDALMVEAQNLAEHILAGFNPQEVTPRHGPGGLATRERGAKKWNFKRKFEAIHRVYPYYEYFTPSRASLLSSIRWYRDLISCESGCARVLLVPKDSRGPRLISMEPLEYQFIQQGLGRALMEHLERKSPVTRGKVNFTDQNINRNLAEWNSVSRRYATLDMKEASDRVSVALVRKVFAKRPDVLKALLATRTTHTELPDGRILRMEKFAPMGSALCFPVEALVFFILAEVLRRRECIGGEVYVYGDDIVVPRGVTPSLFKTFPVYGLKFNEDKCFIEGYFRESCGMDAYKGNVCTPTRMRKVLPFSRKDANGIVSALELSNALYLRGYWRASTYVADCVKAYCKVDVLTPPRKSFGGLSFTSFTSKGVTIGVNSKARFNENLQSYEARMAIGYVPVKPRRKLDGTARLFMNLVGQLQLSDVVPHATAIKMRWYPFYS